MRIRRRYIFLCLLLSAALGINAQELLVKVNVNHSQIEGSEVSVFTNLQQSLEQFLNDRQWTSLQFQKNERIHCTFNITVNKYVREEHLFECTAMIQANRPVFNSAYTSTLFNIKDENFIFKFSEFDQLNYNDETIDNQLRYLATVIQSGEQCPKPFLSWMETLRGQQESLCHHQRPAQRIDEAITQAAI